MNYEQKSSIAPVLEKRFFEDYQQRMNNAGIDKLEHALPYLPMELMSISRAPILSVGAGTGILEKNLSELLQYSLIAMDYSLPMIETLKNEINHEASRKQQEQMYDILAADAGSIPLADNCISAVLAFSVFHEIGSFGDGMKFGDVVTKSFQNIGRVLLPGGRLIVRDFMQPTYPNEPVWLEIGEKQTESDVDPLVFFQNMIDQYKGVDFGSVKDQINAFPLKLVKPGCRLRMSAAEAVDIAVHYSWSKRFTDEVKERYMYLPPKEYSEFIQNSWQDIGVSSHIVTAYSYLQSDYPEHIDGRINIHREDGTSYPIPPFTGCVVIEKDVPQN